MSAVDFADVLWLALIAFGLCGIFVSLHVPEPYSEIGGGELALDVPDGPSAPLASAAGQLELEQLRDAVALLREGHTGSPTAAETAAALLPGRTAGTESALPPPSSAIRSPTAGAAAGVPERATTTTVCGSDPSLCPLRRETPGMSSCRSRERGDCGAD